MTPVLSSYRAEVTALLAGLELPRKPALRRALDDDFLLATDLPLFATAAQVEEAAQRLRRAGWTVGSSSGWLGLDRMPPRPKFAPPKQFAGELGCAIWLMILHPDTQAEPFWLRRLLKAWEAGGQAPDQFGADLHRELAVRLRLHQPLPDLLPWLCAAAQEGEKPC